LARDELLGGGLEREPVLAQDLVPGFGHGAGIGRGVWQNGWKKFTVKENLDFETHSHLRQLQLSFNLNSRRLHLRRNRKNAAQPCHTVPKMRSCANRCQCHFLPFLRETTLDRCLAMFASE
jgi:hypothetical protein